jgi:hypothetical protein
MFDLCCVNSHLLINKSEMHIFTNFSLCDFMYLIVLDVCYVHTNLVVGQSAFIFSLYNQMCIVTDLNLEIG